MEVRRSDYGNFFVVIVLLLLVPVSGCIYGDREERKAPVVKKDSKVEEKLFSSGVIGYAKTSYKEACKRYVKISNPGKTELLRAALKAVKFNDFESGLVLSEKLIELDPGSGQAYFLRGKCIYNSIGGSAASAKADFEKSIELGMTDHQTADALEYLARLAYDEKDVENAVELLTRAIAKDPGHPSYYKFRALMYADLKQFEAAEKDYDKGVELEPGGLMIFFSRAKFYETRERYEEALKDYDRLLFNAKTTRKNSRLKDKVSLVYKYKSRLLAKLGRYPEAIDSISHAIDLNKNLAEEYTIRGEQYLAIDELDKAMKDFTRAIEISQNRSVDAFTGRARVHSKQGRAELAEKDLARAKALSSAPAEKPIYELRRR